MLYRSYLLCLALFVLLCLALVTAFNVAIDPLRFFGTAGLEGVNRYKPLWTFGQMLSKPYQVSRMRPDGLILGTSRAETSIRPGHPGWNGYRVYNLALPGMSVSVQWMGLQHAQRASPLRRVVMELDLYMFNNCSDQNREEAVVDYTQRLRLAEGNINWSYPARLLADYLRSAVSLEMTQMSVRTLQAQPRYAALSTDSQPVFQSGYSYRSPGPGTSLRRRFQRFERIYMDSVWAPRRCYGLGVGGDETQLHHFEDILRFSHRNDIELLLYFSPFHARLAETMDMAGLWVVFEELKRRLIQLNEEVAAEVGREVFPMRDFSGYNSVTTEAVPALEQTGMLMRGFRDGTHVLPAVGDRILAVLLQEGVAPVGSDGFGVLLDSDMLEDHLREQRRQRERWRLANPGEVEELRRLVGAGN